MNAHENTKTFYVDLPVVPTFLDAFSEKYYVEVPEDWWVALTDVRGSTKLIQEGRYKDVNVAGALAAMAVANVLSGLEYPYVFGGDGMTFLFPGAFEPEVRAVLWDTKKKVQEFYGMDLRVALIPVSDIQQRGHSIRVAKLRTSDYYTQAMMLGDGVDVAEKWLKNPEPGQSYLLEEEPAKKLEADFTGFTCRWQDVKSDFGETISLIVRQQGDGSGDPVLIQNILQKIYEIYGDEEKHHPIRETQMKSVTKFSQMKNEARATSGKKRGLGYFLKLWKIRLQVWVVRFAVFWQIPLQFSYINLKKIKEHNVVASDFKKYDGSLKMVISGTQEQRERLVAFLDEKYKAGEIFYGIHVSDRALLTCLLHQQSELETHFVDAADGGYALAAKQLKEQMRLAMA